MQTCREGKTGVAEKAANASHNLPVDSSQPKRKLIPYTQTTKSLKVLPFATFKQLRPMNLNGSINAPAEEPVPELEAAQWRKAMQYTGRKLLL